MYLEKINLDITVVNPRFLTGLDEELLDSLKENHELVITLEDGELMGGMDKLLHHSMEQIKCWLKIMEYQRHFIQILIQTNY